MNTQSQKFIEFKETLEKIFQTDRSDLDFGIYRIMNLKHKEVRKFIDEDLRKFIKDEYDKLGNDTNDAQEELSNIKKQLANLGVSSAQIEENEKVKELKQKISNITSHEHFEDQIYSWCVDFFNRYYEDGDFVSKRRYKKDVYAIPYNGEEVKLHWANSDQYYVKTTENFDNYSFKLPNGKKVSFYINQATIEKDNNKEAEDKQRRFVLNLDEQFSFIEGDELKLAFAYTENKEKQDKLNADYIKQILEKFAKGEFTELAIPMPTEKNKNRTLLEKHLNTYTTKNTADYFIHKDLKGFLTRELDFYIKNEILYIDDLDEAVIKENLSKVKTFKKISNKIIDFVSSLEELQKKLWLKKKFVISSEYCLTLDKLFAFSDSKDETEKNKEKLNELYTAICNSADQKAEWVKLGFISEDTEVTQEYLRENKFLVLDTKFFPEYKYFILSLFENLDEELDGLLINSENFGALSLLQEKYREKVQTCYIDPPYNANSSKILYKNSFENSSWISFMENRIRIFKIIGGDNTKLVCAIDEHEQEYLGLLLRSIFPLMENTCIVVNHNPSGKQGDNFSYTHEYSYVVYPDIKRSINMQLRIDSKDWDLRNFRDVTGKDSLRNAAKTCFYAIKISRAEKKIIGFGDVCDENFHPKVNQTDGDIICIYPIDPQGIERKWRFSRDTVESIKDSLRVHFIENRDVYDIKRLKKKFNFKTNWFESKYSGNNHGTQLLNEILPNNSFSFPKSIYTVMDFISATSLEDNTILDFFAGSGTTGHAVIKLNREDQGKRKYILVEMGKYFDTVLKPRIQKVVYTDNWKDGKPQDKVGISQFFKYQKLESYEDTLNNLAFEDKLSSGMFRSNLKLKEDYFLNYMMDLESEKSLLDIDKFTSPFGYKIQVLNDVGEMIPTNIDLVETFNYLIGLEVANIQEFKGLVLVTGKTRDGKKSLVIWRDVSTVDNKALNEFLEKREFNPRDNEYDVIYVNGDNNIVNTSTDTEAEQFKVVLIEEEFKKRMFSN